MIRLQLITGHTAHFDNFIDLLDFVVQRMREGGEL